MSGFREQIVELTESLNSVAHNMAKGLPFEDYLVQVGKYRALREFKIRLEEKVKRREVDDAEPLGGQSEEPTIRRPAAINRPRSWGGGRTR